MSGIKVNDAVSVIVDAYSKFSLLLAKFHRFTYPESNDWDKDGPDIHEVIY